MVEVWYFIAVIGDLDHRKQLFITKKIETMIVYLSGGMEHANNDGAGWRLKFARWLQNNLEHEVINPVQESRKLVQEKNATNYRAQRLKRKCCQLLVRLRQQPQT